MRRDGEKLVAIRNQLAINCLDIREKAVDRRAHFRILDLGLQFFCGFFERVKITVPLDPLRFHRASQSVGFAFRLLVFDCWHVSGRDNPFEPLKIVFSCFE